MSQANKILNILKDEDWHCVNEFIETFSVDYRRRLVDLKKQGYMLISRRCENPNHHHTGGSKEWLLVQRNLNGELLNKHVQPENQRVNQIL